MYSWANHPKIDSNNQISITASKSQHIPSKEFVTIDLGLILVSLPKHHILKIINPQKKYIIISKFWLPSCDKLSLTIVAKNPFQLVSGKTICHLQLLPVLHFLPGNLSLTCIPPISNHIYIVDLNFSFIFFITELQLEKKKTIRYYGKYKC